MLHVAIRRVLFISLALFFIGCGNSSTQPNNPNPSNNSDATLEYNCDIIIDKSYYEICYNYRLKSPLFVSYYLDGDKVDSINIKERPQFYNEISLDERYQTTHSDYTGSGYDRGHLAPDASFDWSNKSLTSTYTMANITPQNPEFNRGIWAKLENYERVKAKELTEVKVEITVVFDDNPQHIGESELSVPLGFYKRISNSSKSFSECYYYNNLTTDSDDISDDKIECSLVPSYD